MCSHDCLDIIELSQHSKVALYFGVDRTAISFHENPKSTNKRCSRSVCDLSYQNQVPDMLSMACSAFYAQRLVDAENEEFEELDGMFGVCINHLYFTPLRERRVASKFPSTYQAVAQFSFSLFWFADTFLCYFEWRGGEMLGKGL
jgi:hypothetical protein